MLVQCCKLLQQLCCRVHNFLAWVHAVICAIPHKRNIIFFSLTFCSMQHTIPKLDQMVLQQTLSVHWELRQNSEHLWVNIFINHFETAGCTNSPRNRLISFRKCGGLGLVLLLSHLALSNWGKHWVVIWDGSEHLHGSCGVNLTCRRA